MSEAANAQHEDLLRIGQAAIALYDLAPAQAAAAARLERHAQEQAETAARVAELANQLALALQSAVSELEASSRDALAALGSIKQVTDTTKILAINARIEAERAGAAGRAFSVIANEVRSLAQHAFASTGKITETMGTIRESIERVGRMVSQDAAGAGEAGEDGGEACNVHAVDRAMKDVAGSVRLQLDDVGQVRQMSEAGRTLSEQLLLAVGRFRFNVHEMGQQAVAGLAADPRVLSLDRFQAEGALLEALRRHPFFDLFYLTDARGRQVTRNISPICENDAHAGREALGKDWSGRPWFTGALPLRKPCVSDLYLSVATQTFCFTVSQSLRDERGEVLGVLAGDVSFTRLVKA